MRISDWSSDVCSSDLGCTRWRRCMKMSLKLPMFGMNMEEGTIARWHVQLGADFALGDILYEVDTVTLSSAVDAPCAGTLIYILVSDGEIVLSHVCTPVTICISYSFFFLIFTFFFFTFFFFFFFFFFLF